VDRAAQTVLLLGPFCAALVGDRSPGRLDG